MLCDWCDTDSEFEQQAINAPGNYSPIYVTNRYINGTRKYDRTIFTDDPCRGVQQTVIVSTPGFPSADQAVFEKVAENANLHDETFERNELVGAVFGIGEAGSTVGSISNGYISNLLVNAIKT